MISILEFIATLAASLFTGASIYINLVEHPTRLIRGIAIAITEFAPSYKRSTVMQLLLSATSFLSSIIARFMDASIYWLINGSRILTDPPYTVIDILPSDNHLFQSSF